MEEFKEQILRVLRGESQSEKSKTLISPNEVDTFLRRENGFERDNFDSNGWDWDFWQSYIKDGKVYVLSGSGWYNSGLTFYIEDER